MKTENLEIQTEGFYDPKGREMWVSDDKDEWNKCTVLSFTPEYSYCYCVLTIDERYRYCAIEKDPRDRFKGCFISEIENEKQLKHVQNELKCSENVKFSELNFGFALVVLQIFFFLPVTFLTDCL